MPPKNMISVARNNHMPSDEAPRCCSMSAKRCCSTGFRASAMTALSGKARLLRSGNLVVVVGFPGDLWRLFKIESRRGRRGLPFQTGSAPGVGFGNLSVPHGPQEINHGKE